MDFCTPSVLRNVIGDDVAHGLSGRDCLYCHRPYSLSTGKSRVFSNFARQVFCDEPRLQFNTAPVFHLVAKDWLRDLLVQPLLEAREEQLTWFFLQAICS